MVTLTERGATRHTQNILRKCPTEIWSTLSTYYPFHKSKRKFPVAEDELLSCLSPKSKWWCFTSMVVGERFCWLWVPYWTLIPLLKQSRFHGKHRKSWKHLQDKSFHVPLNHHFGRGDFPNFVSFHHVHISGVPENHHNHNQSSMSKGHPSLWWINLRGVGNNLYIYGPWPDSSPKPT